MTSERNSEEDTEEGACLRREVFLVQGWDRHDSRRRSASLLRPGCR